MVDPLEARVHGLSASDLGLISREMYLNDIPPFEQDDIVMYWYLGSELYTTMLYNSFRAGELEAKMRNIEPHGPKYCALQYKTKRRMWRDMYKLFDPIEKTDFSKFKFVPITDAEMYQRVRERLRRTGYSVD